MAAEDRPGGGPDTPGLAEGASPGSAAEPAAAYPSAQAVAARAGVSRSAVSRAFTPGASIAPATRARIVRAAEELGYEVNDLARGLLSRKSRLIGLVVTAPEEGFRAHLVGALTRALVLRDRAPIVVNTGRSAADITAAQKMLVGYRVEGTIVLSGSPPAAVVDLARRNGQPLVLMGRFEPGSDHVNADNAGAAAQAVALFTALGRSRLGFVGAVRATPSVVERETAFRAAAEERGLAVRIGRGGESSYAGGREAAAAMLDAGPAPDAVFCVNDLMALGFMDVVRGRGLRVPDDLAVIGFDDIPEAGWESYALTTFRQDPARMAAEAIGLLERRREFPQSSPVTIRVAVPLVPRRSCPLPV
ncbi:LacI family DNA-binding transcriptional regulator [Prosthecomicrobium pneumaticum]|uniref:DNA-binding LacI/PurR family transcriptional regulator n=1 Tax=Prosthecomicrobium pneumaticum TaxID=81895 RepID=A0A7W9CUQ8_9HYPH|nr:LacI family DNA-binding transcriptional regulator [Prosthecomicrobium pneumaticum]MBB5752257.1 DNA-binding LacI/PurR family transcriptional regulator [Prosthecomicrobium pneumaticum]